MKRLLAVGVLLLAGCSQAAPTPAPTTQPPTTPAAGPAVFLTYARAASFGDKDFATATDEQLLDVANLACDEGLGAGLPFGRVVQGYVESDAHPTTGEAEAFTRAAVVNLCPENAIMLP